LKEERGKKFKFKTRQKKWLEQSYIDGWCNTAGRAKFYGHKKTSLGDARISKEVKKKFKTWVIESIELISLINLII
jgi:hypothetical protein